MVCHPSSPSREDREADDTSMPAPVKAMIHCHEN